MLDFESAMKEVQAEAIRAKQWGIILPNGEFSYVLPGTQEFAECARKMVGKCVIVNLFTSDDHNREPFVDSMRVAEAAVTAANIKGEPEKIFAWSGRVVVGDFSRIATAVAMDRSVTNWAENAKSYFGDEPIPQWVIDRLDGDKYLIACHYHVPQALIEDYDATLAKILDEFFGL